MRFASDIVSMLYIVISILVLYKWWKNERPQRLDPMVASGWSDYCKERRKTATADGDDSVLAGFIINVKDDTPTSNILDAYHRMEEEQEAEDAVMMTRLIKIRRSLWT